MTSAEKRVMNLWSEHGLLTTGIGPEADWFPVPPHLYQEDHNEFWSVVSGMMPDDEADEPYWMTQAATAELLEN